MVRVRVFITAIMLCLGVSCIQAQALAVKTNLLSDMTLTPTIGGEVSLGTRSSLNLVYGINPWTFRSDTHGHRKAKFWVLMPEYRWWSCSVFNGHFFGVHAMGGQFNAMNVNLPIPGAFFGGDNIRSQVRHSRYQGGYAGLGLTYGYQWILSRHWNLEAEVGLGYNYVWYDKYGCGECEGKVKSGHTNYAGITKLGLSVLYIF